MSITNSTVSECFRAMQSKAANVSALHDATLKSTLGDIKEQLSKDGNLNAHINQCDPKFLRKLRVIPSSITINDVDVVCDIISNFYS